MLDQKFIEYSLKELAPILQPYWEIDHICYRTTSNEEYLQKKIEYSQLGKLLIESEVGGRPIATFALNTPILSSHGLTTLLELPAPKKGKVTPSGLEHIEVVVDVDFKQLIEENPHLNWDDRAINKELNPELEANFEGYNVKFHHHSLDCIVEIEKHEKALNFLVLLKAFKEFNPLISGSIPLGISTQNSDLDVLMQTDNFDLLNRKIQSHFPDAQIKVNQDYLIAKMIFQNLPIEIYAENQSPLKQKAHRHLRIENRILKIMGETFKENTIRLKKDGLKTEPAFGKLLGLTDPYEELLELHDLSDIQLMNKFNINFTNS